MNEREHWNRIGSGYDNEIFDVFRSDRKQVLRHYFYKHANPRGHAIDFGCGTGKAFPYLSSAFKRITGFDIADNLLKVAETRPYKNITLKRADLTRTDLRVEPADFLFSCNVIMLPDLAMNRAMFRNVYRSLKKRGVAILVIPSLESMFYAGWRMLDWFRREGTNPEDVPASDMAYFSSPRSQLVEGIIQIDGVPTKHYTEPELRVLLADAGLQVTAVERVEYAWDSEFSEPPAWMKDPYPWDWLVECRRGK